MVGCPSCQGAHLIVTKSVLWGHKWMCSETEQRADQTTSSELVARAVLDALLQCCLTHYHSRLLINTYLVASRRKDDVV